MAGEARIGGLRPSAFLGGQRVDRAVQGRWGAGTLRHGAGAPAGIRPPRCVNPAVNVSRTGRSAGRRPKRGGEDCRSDEIGHDAEVPAVRRFSTVPRAGREGEKGRGSGPPPGANRSGGTYFTNTSTLARVLICCSQASLVRPFSCVPLAISLLISRSFSSRFSKAGMLML